MKLKYLVIILAIFTFVPALTLADSSAEEDLKKRIHEFLTSKDLNNIETVMLKDKSHPFSDLARTHFYFQYAMLSGISDIQFEEIYDVIKEDLKNPIVIDGKQYEPTVEPYKMMVIKYKDYPKHGSTGWSTLVGFHNEKLYLTGYRELK